MKQLIQKRSVKFIIAVGVLLFTGIVFALHVTNVPLRKVGLGALFTSTQLWANFVTLIIFVFCGAVISMLLFRKTSAAFRFITSSAFILVSLIAAILQIISIPNLENYYLFFVIYKVFGGIGIGMSYGTVFSTTSSWFPGKIGFSILLIFSAIALGVLIVGSLGGIIYFILNAATIDWLVVYIIFSIIISVLMIMLSSFIRLSHR